MADTVINGKILGHSVNQIMPSGEVTYTGIEFEKDDGEVVWLTNITMQSRCHYLFDGAMAEGETVTLWMLGSGKTSLMYGITVGDRYAYEPPANGVPFAFAFVCIVVGALSAFILIGIPVLLLGIHVLLRALSLSPKYPERVVKTGEIEAKASGYGIEALAKDRAASSA